jgi:NAD(P)-dependent dehydrogenase (short-subunit alcohol dehydrogenase family)
MKTIDPKIIDFKHLYDLTDKVIIITGNKGLIGRAFEEACTQYGATVIGWDKPDMDVVNPTLIKESINKIIEEYGKIDGLVNCHQYIGPNFFKPFEDYDNDEWDSIIDVNLTGTYLTCKYVGRQMVKQGYGNIVNIPSTYSVVAPNQDLYKGMKQTLKSPASYAASKGGIIALSKYLSTYWAKDNIRVNMITPHGVWNNHEEVFENNFSKLSPMGRLSSNYEVAGGLVYLLSDASSYVTGHNLIIDGGWTVW